MNRNGFAAAATLIFVLSLVSGTSRQVWALDAKPQYASMAPLDQYLMADRNAEITLARSAAPPALARDATVLVLEKSGYKTAVEGKNGFTCLVERSWIVPFDNHEFWNPKIRGPICFNPAAVRSVLPYTVNRTRLVLAGLSEAQIRESLIAAVAKNELPPPAPGAMSYMMSKEGFLGDAVGHWCSHIMFHIPKTDVASWGANLEGSPVFYEASSVAYGDDGHDSPEPETIFMAPVFHWSDGSPASH